MNILCNLLVSHEDYSPPAARTRQYHARIVQQFPPILGDECYCKTPATGLTHFVLESCEDLVTRI